MATVTTTRLNKTLKKVIYLNFDLNRTVLMSDAAGGRSMDDTVNYLLSEICYGKVVESDDNNDGNNATRWVASGETKPYPGNEVPIDKTLVTYKSFGDNLYKYKTSGSVEDVAHNKAMKKHRKKLQSSFTNENNPGESFRPYLEQVMNALEMKDESTKKLAKNVAETIEPGLLKEFWEDGKYFLLPSFLKLLVYLQDDPMLLSQVRIVYRTFGSDLEEVAKELSIFNQGKHPLYPGVKLSDKLLLKEPYGVFFRNSDESDGTSLILGTIDKAPKDCTDLKTFYAKSDKNKVNTIQIKNGFHDCSNTITSMLSNDHNLQTLGLRDYWEWWHAHGESDDSGKILIINSKNADSEHHCFIDDHVEADHSHIVDVRDGASGSKIPFEKSINFNIFRSEPFLAITQENYFINMFENIAAMAEEGSNL
eukprot:g1651.t1